VSAANSLPSVETREPYRPRSVRFLELWRPQGWLVKLYGIAYGRETPAAALVAAAKVAAAETLPQPARADGRYGVAVVIVHQGQDACWLLLDWWGHECILHHRLLRAPLAGEPRFERPPADMTACVWELPVLMFERDAWVVTVLAENGPGIGGYLDHRFNGEV
jgi:hypothetical protein